MTQYAKFKVSIYSGSACSIILLFYDNRTIEQLEDIKNFLWHSLGILKFTKWPSMPNVKFLYTVEVHVLLFYCVMIIEQ